MLAGTDGTIFLGIVLSSIFSVALIAFVLILCLGKKKNGDEENGVIKSSGSYTRKTSKDEFGQGISNIEHNEQHTKVEVETGPLAKANEITDSNNRMSLELNQDSTDNKQSELDVPVRPKVPTPNPMENRENVKGQSEKNLTNKPNEPAVEFSGENSGSAEASGDGMYARVKNVQNREPEIAYSVVELQQREEEYEFVDNKVKRKISLDIESVQPVIQEDEAYSRVVETKDPKLIQEPGAPNIYAKVDEARKEEDSATHYMHEDSGGSDLYATVTEMPKHSSLPSNSKRPHSKLSIFKQSKRRSKTMDDTANMIEDTTKSVEKKGGKKKHHIHLGRLKSDSDDKARTPTTPPPPPLESLKSITKEMNKRKSGADDSANSTKSSEGTPASSPRLGALPSIPPSQFGFTRASFAQDDYDDDDMYERLGASETALITTQKDNSKGIVSKSKPLISNDTNVTNKVKSSKNVDEGVQNQSQDKRMRPLPSTNDNSRLTRHSDDLTDGANNEVVEMYAQVDKKRKTYKQRKTTDQVVIDDRRASQDSATVPDAYAVVEKRKNSRSALLENMEHFEGGATSDKGRTEVLSDDTEGNPYATITLTHNDDTDKNYSLTDHNKKRSQSNVELFSENSLDHEADRDTAVSSDDDLSLRKRRSQTEPVLDDNPTGLKKFLYAQVDFEKKRESRRIGETYAKVNKPKTGTKTFHRAEPETYGEEEILYEGAYNIISENKIPKAAADIDDQGYVKSRGFRGPKPIGSATVEYMPSTAYVSADMDKAQYDNDEEEYERVDELKK